VGVEEIEQMGSDVRPFSANGGLNCHHSCAQVEKNGSKSHRVLTLPPSPLGAAKAGRNHIIK
jgi:hypothetical protein